ncbi:MAG TPA: hypothetical protein VLL52_03105 [Anaerolineae bacterium]|nr:hypothetical protein [Anaerolineae bacterium]
MSDVFPQYYRWLQQLLWIDQLKIDSAWTPKMVVAKIEKLVTGAPPPATPRYQGHVEGQAFEFKHLESGPWSRIPLVRGEVVAAEYGSRLYVTLTPPANLVVSLWLGYMLSFLACGGVLWQLWLDGAILAVAWAFLAGSFLGGGSWAIFGLLYAPERNEERDFWLQLLPPPPIAPLPQLAKHRKLTKTVQKELVGYLQSAERLTAVHRVQQLTEWPLKESREYVDLLARKQVDAAHDEEIRQLLVRGYKEGAVQRLQERTGWSEQEAAVYVADLEQRLRPTEKR